MYCIGAGSEARRDDDDRVLHRARSARAAPRPMRRVEAFWPIAT